MRYRHKQTDLAVLFAILAGTVVFSVVIGLGQTNPNAGRSRQVEASPAPSPTPKEREEFIADEDVVRVETDLTNVLFTAVDSRRRFLTDLQASDVRVLEDGVPQEIFTFQRQTDLPLSLAILIDTSVSQERTLPEEMAAARAFVESVMRPGKDETAVVTFTGEATLELGLTGSINRVRSALDRVRFVPPSGYIGGGNVAGTPPISGTNQQIAGSTALWDAVWVTSEEVLSRTSDKTRRAIILLTDGVDTSSQKKIDQAINQAIKSDAVVYSIGIYDPYFPGGGMDKGSLRKLSERTGGRAFFPTNETQLREAFEQIQLELRSQFLVAYSPTNKKRDGTYRKVQVDLLNPDLKKRNVKLSYRQGYYARPSDAVPGS